MEDLLLRGKGEHLDKSLPDYAEQKKQVDEEENEFLSNALEGFLVARQTENFPMCGMDEPTVDYLIAMSFQMIPQHRHAAYIGWRLHACACR